MANQSGPLETLTGFAVLALFCLCIYLGNQVYRKSLKKINPVIQANIRRAKNGALTGSEEDFQIVPQSRLLDTRSQDGVQQLTVIDAWGIIFVNNKGIHYVGKHRRLSWDWNKLMEIRPSRRWYDVSFEFVVSNRQKIAGFTFAGTQATLEIVYSFLDWRGCDEQKKKSAPKTSTDTSRGEGAESATNITYNIVQNVQDSVIQGNIEIKEK